MIQISAFDRPVAECGQRLSIILERLTGAALRLQLAQRTGDTKKIHAVLTDMLKIWPKDAAVQNDEGYTRLLLLGGNRREHGARSTEQGAGEPGAGEGKYVREQHWRVSLVRSDSARLCYVDRSGYILANPGIYGD